jgi:hypothetical protein
MPTLRQFISEKHMKYPNQNGRWIETTMSDSGYMGNHGPELGEAFLNFERPYMYSGSEVTVKYESSWEKIHDSSLYPAAFYPIIGFSLSLENQSVPGCLYQTGENVWWDTVIDSQNNLRDDITSGLYNYKLTSKVSGGNYAQNEYNFEQYWDELSNEYIRVGFDTVCRASYAPRYDQYWFEDPLTESHSNVLAARSWCPGTYVTGNVRVGPGEFDFLTCNSNTYTEQAPCQISLDTNIPIVVWDFDWGINHQTEINGSMHGYLSDGDLSRFAQYVADGHCVISNGYRQPTTQGVKTFSCYSDIYQGTWGYAGVENETFIGYRYLQIFVKPSLTAQAPRVTLIKDPTPTELRARLKVYGDIEKVRYSTDGGNSWSESDSLPWEYLYYKRTDELGSLKYDQNHGGNILLFASEALSDDGADYLAEDYAEKSQYYPSTNTSGTEETSTTMGVTTLNSFFQRMYIVDKADMATISSALYDTSAGGIWEDIKKGIEMFGENPIDCVAGLCYFPLDLTQVFRGASSASSVFFGGYQLTGVSCYELMNYNGYVDIGTMEIKESFPHGSYRNYEPYTALKIWLPFIGLKELHLNKYIGKMMAIRYYFDCFNGGCMAVIFSDGLVADIFDGMAGVQIPISLTDFASYAAAQIQNFTELGSSAVSAVAPLTGGASPSSLIGAAAGFGNYEKALFSAEQTTTSDFNSTKGASSAMINQYLPNYVYVIFEIIEEDETRLLSELMGKPSNASGTLGSFSGYLEIDEVELKTSAGMTETEKNNFISLLHSGIII